MWNLNFFSILAICINENKALAFLVRKMWKLDEGECVILPCYGVGLFICSSGFHNVFTIDISLRFFIA